MKPATRCPSYLYRNPHSYCFRIRVPSDIQPVLAKKELRYSLQTGYLVLAKQKTRYLAGTLASGEDVLVSGFGKFQVRQKSERLGRNPATDEGMMLRPRKVVTFKCSRTLRDKVNGR